MTGFSMSFRIKCGNIIGGSEFSIAEKTEKT